MSLLMMHKAYMPVYIVIQIFLAHGMDGRDQPKVVQEVLADLKIGGETSLIRTFAK